MEEVIKRLMAARWSQCPAERKEILEILLRMAIRVRKNKHELPRIGHEFFMN